MRFFPTLRENLTSPQSYWLTLHFPLRSSIIYWVMLYAMLLAAGIIAVVAATFAARSLIQAQYPDDLMLSYADGKVSSNKPLPLSTTQLGVTLTTTETAVTLSANN